MKALNLKCMSEELNSIMFLPVNNSVVNPNGLDIVVSYGLEPMESVVLSERDSITLYQFLKAKYEDG